MTIATNGVGSIRGHKQVISNYIVATSNDTTASGDGPTMDNRDGRVTRVAFGVVHTAGSGTTPTNTVTLKGSFDGSTFFTVLDSGGNAIATSAVDVDAPASEFEDTNAEGIISFPPFLRLSYALGGTSPGWTGTISLELDRMPRV